MSTFDQLMKRRDFEPCKFAELVERPAWQPCNRTEDPYLTVGTWLLGLAPVLVVIFFAVL